MYGNPYTVIDFIALKITYFAQVEKVVPLEDNSGWGKSVLEALRLREAAVFEEKVAKVVAEVRGRSHSTSTAASSLRCQSKPKAERLTIGILYSH